MAAPNILYPTNYLSNPAERSHNSRRIAAPTTDIPNADLRATLQDLTNVARDLTTDETLRLEIDKLCTATLTIDDAFYSIGRKLSDASNEQNNHVDLYNTCYALETRWNEHHLVGPHFINCKVELIRNIDIPKPPLALQGVRWGSARCRGRYDS